MKFKKLLQHGMTTVLTVSMLAPTAVVPLTTVAAQESITNFIQTVNAETSAAAEHDDGSPSGCYNPDYENIPEEAKRPTQAIDFSQYRTDYYNTILEVPVYLYNSDQDNTYSMGNPALTHTAYIVVDKNGEATVKLQFHGMDYAGQYGHLQRMTYFNTTQDMYDWAARKPGYENLPQQVEVERKTGANYEQVSFKLPSGDPLVGISPYVDMMGTVVTALVGFDYSNVKVLNGSVGDFSGTEMTEWYIEQFENNINWEHYSDSYADTFQQDLMDAKNYINYGINPDNSNIEYINKGLSSDYNQRSYHLRKNKVINKMKGYQEETQGDFTDESWAALTDCYGYFDFMNSADCTDADVVDIENEWNEALNGLITKDGVASYSEQLMKVVEECEALESEKDNYLTGAWNAFSRLVANGRETAETGDAIQCRRVLNESATWKDELYPKRKVVEDGIYEVTVTPKQMDENNNLVESTALNDQIDFSQKMKVKIYNGKATLTLSVKDKDTFPYLVISNGNGQHIGDNDSYWVEGSNMKEVTLANGETKEVPLEVVLQLPSQPEAKDTTFRYHMIDENGKSTDGTYYQNTAYLDVDYEHATKTSDIQVDKTDLRTLLDRCEEIGRNDYNGLLKSGYTEESARAMVDAYDAANKTYKKSNSQYEIDAALNSIYDADDHLVTYTDLFKNLADEAGLILNNPISRAEYTEDSINNLSSVYDETYKIVVSDKVSNQEIKAATEKLQSAYDNLKKADGSDEVQVDKTALNDKLNEAKAITADGYTEASFKSLQDAITAAQAVADNKDATQADVDAQVLALDNAVKALVKEDEQEKTDKTALTEKLNEAKAITAEGYTDESYQALQAAIQKAEEVLNNDKASQADVDTQVNALDVAIASLVDDGTVLRDGVYTLPVTLMHATTPGQDSMGNKAIKDNSGTLSIKDGKGTLQLEMVPLPIANLNGYLLSMEVADPENTVMTSTNILDWKNSKFLETNYIEYYDVVDDFNKPEGAADPNAAGKPYPKILELQVVPNQTETWVHVYVPAMGTLSSGDQVARLTLDYENIEVKSEKTDLQNKITEAETLLTQTDKYTAESLKALQNALDLANAVANNPSASQDDINAQIEALQAAIDALEEIQAPVSVDKTALNTKLTEAKELAAQTDKYTEDSLKALQTAIDAAQAIIDKTDATQSDVDTQVTNLDNAIKALVEKDQTPNGGEDNNKPNTTPGGNAGSNNNSGTNNNLGNNTLNGNAASGSNSSQKGANTKTGIENNETNLGVAASFLAAAGALTGGFIFKRKKSSNK